MEMNILSGSPNPIDRPGSRATPADSSTESEDDEATAPQPLKGKKGTRARSLSPDEAAKHSTRGGSAASTQRLQRPGTLGASSRPPPKVPSSDPESPARPRKKAKPASSSDEESEAGHKRPVRRGARQPIKQGGRRF